MYVEGGGGVFGIKKKHDIQHGRHGKPAAQILHCPSNYCRFQLVMDFGCPGVSSGGGGGRGLFGIIKQIC